ncbi:hypothetical protein TVAG_353590 [Trichomonas vaginalis G3]|uniref:Cyclin C-terminal domain-containing protein n=1 Tax=Trichomonas vaginalis (strain ATCC PRA-98 / G3) TaxID=412133 RepID=A2EN81_TRIV3|nr:cyclin family [Trichomonas vaginalis G3]EAY05918.1 hypothetical protein TVAG_353590 [Trichomonas vaginalis G3]KAI5520191.1 cyclin family [Trichomonas vaginalis G3]|eukprot:XP_001318141.1 hypothetical protein [Trichomonas vaginalis G3]
MNQYAIPQPDFRKDPTVTGSHEEYWVVYPKSQWNNQWNYSSKDLEKQILDAVQKIRRIGVRYNMPPRLIHYTQLLIWRFYAKEQIDTHPLGIYILQAFECAARFVECEIHNYIQSIQADPDFPKSSSLSTNTPELLLHFQFVTSLEYTVRIHHPSEYIPMYLKPQQYGLDPDIVNLAEKIVSDSFLTPCCLVHRPAAIAEGAVIMAATILDRQNSICVRSAKALSFISDMKFYYDHSQKL